MPAIYDRVKETSLTTGTGAFTLQGAVTGFRSFVSTIGATNQTYYCIEQPNTSSWEVGLGTLSDSTTLTRDSVFASSNSDSLVDFGSGTKNVFIPIPAQVAVYTGASYTDPEWVTSLAGNKITEAISTKTSAYTITSDDSVILADATSSAFSITLPTAVGRSGKKYFIKRINDGSNNVTVDTTSGQTIDGETSQVLTTQYETITVISDNSNWHII